MDSKQKPIGTREEVYKGLAPRTAGGLTRDDIIEKRIGNKILYISRKLSDKMKNNLNLARNPNHVRRIQKRTMNNMRKIQEQDSQLRQKQQQQTGTFQQQQQQSAHHSTSKTMKIQFNNTDNVSRAVYYPELKGLNIKQLKEDLVREELEEDRGLHLPPKQFIIEDINSADLDIDITAI